MINKYINKDYINNSSDILSFTKDIEFKEIISKLDINKNIKVTNNLIHKTKNINQIEQFIFNLDNYITFLKEMIYIKPLELRYIINLTLYNSYNKILYSNLYYYDNIDYYHKEFKKLFMHNYNINYKIYSKYKKTHKKDFYELIKTINSNKRAYIYFEKLSNNNLSFYIELYKLIESN